jgi:hypothetical protein
MKTGAITIEALPDLVDTVADVERDEGVERECIYAPLQQVTIMGGGTRTLPYPSRSLLAR